MNFTNEEKYYISRTLQMLEFGEWDCLFREGIVSVFGKLDNLFIMVRKCNSQITIEVREIVQMLDRYNKAYKNLYGTKLFMKTIEKEHSLYRYISNIFLVHNLRKHSERA